MIAFSLECELRVVLAVNVFDFACCNSAVEEYEQAHKVAGQGFVEVGAICRSQNTACAAQQSGKVSDNGANGILGRYG